MLSDNSDGQIQGKQNYEVLVARYLNERAVLVDREACCLEWYGSPVIMQAKLSAH